MKPDHFGTCGDTFKLLNGGYMNLLNPDPKLIDLQSIAVSLSRICRFGGHCPKFYSVAEHCVHATELAYRDGVRGNDLRAILMHDATEAFLGDMIKPLKNLLPEYSVIESSFERAVGSAFNIRFSDHSDIVKHYDRVMLKAEKENMWPDDASQWLGFANLPDRPVQLQFWNPELAAAKFRTYAQFIRVFGSSLSS